MQCTRLQGSRVANDLDRFSKTYGPATIRAVETWVAAHIKHNSEIRMSWFDRMPDLSRDYLIQHRHLKESLNVIAPSVDDTTRIYTVVGTLLDWNVRRRRFEFDLGTNVVDPLSRFVDGKIAEHFDSWRPLRMTETYKAELLLVRKTSHHSGRGVVSVVTQIY